MQNKKKLIVILGPTASGKTKLAIEVAQKLSTEIISADSRQIYKGIPIATAQPTFEQLSLVKHHLIGEISLTTSYNAANFCDDSLKILESIFEKNDYAVVCGGTGLYIDALCYGIDAMPDVPAEIIANLTMRAKNEGLEVLVDELATLDPFHHSVVDRKNTYRVIRALSVCIASEKPYSSFKTQQNVKRDFEIIKIGINPNKKTLDDNIKFRIEEMLKNGLVEEAKAILKYKSEKSANTIGLKEIFDYIEGAVSLKQAEENIFLHTRQYAKRQMTWFKRCKSTKWLEKPSVEEVFSFVK